jgi:hypothetical protein
MASTINISMQILEYYRCLNPEGYINETNKHIPIIHWTPFTTMLNCYPFGGYHTIGDETNFELIDGHFSEKGQIQLAEDMMKIIKRKLEGKNLI